MKTAKSVSTEIVLTHTSSEGVRTPVAATLSYRAGEPYALGLAFHVAPRQSVEWVFARDLLSDGLVRPTGEGDVRVWPGGPFVHVLLSSPNGNASFEVPTDVLVAFLSSTFDLVPLGRESDQLDLDLELGDLIRRTEWRGV